MFAIVMCLVFLIYTLTIYILCVLMVEYMSVVVNVICL